MNKQVKVCGIVAGLSNAAFESLEEDEIERIKGGIRCVVSLRKVEPTVEDLPCQMSVAGGLSMEAGL